MNIFWDIILELLSWFLPWRSGHDDRSIVGESDLDIREKKYKITVISALVILTLSIGIYFYFRG